MRRFVLTAILATCIVSQARAEPYFVPIDGSDQSYTPKDFGYKIATRTEAGRFHISIELDEAAAKAVRGAGLNFTKGDHVVVTTAVGLERTSGGKSAYLNLSLDPKLID